MDIAVIKQKSCQSYLNLALKPVLMRPWSICLLLMCSVNTLSYADKYNSNPSLSNQEAIAQSQAVYKKALQNVAPQAKNLNPCYSTLLMKEADRLVGGDLHNYESCFPWKFALNGT